VGGEPVRARTVNRAVCWLIGLVLVAAGCSSDQISQDYKLAVVDQFDDGTIMNRDQAQCVADDLDGKIDWRSLESGGIEPDEVFGDGPLGDRLSSDEIDAVVAAVDTCRNAGAVVLAVFEEQGQMGAQQISCFASRLTQPSARDLLRLIISDDQSAFTGSEGEILLGICGRAVNE
jgi:hypothetical protein